MKLQHIMYRNQGTDWLNVCSVQCPVCKLDRALLSLRTLWANLGFAGALCHSYALGSNPPDLGPGERIEYAQGHVAWIPDGVWQPGCGKAAP